MSKLFIPPHQNARNSFGLFAVRLIAGIAFVMHGWPKIQDPAGWIDGAQQSGGAVSDILVTLAPVAAIGEFLGGILLVIGLMSPIAALLLMGTMAGAVYHHVHRGDPFIGVGASYELAAVYFVTAFLLLLTGPGGLSMDKVLFKKS